MASVSVSHSILFIASLVAAAGVAGTLVQGVDEVSAAIDDRSLDVSQDIRSDMEVISDPSSPVYNRSGNGNLTLLLKNTGTTALPSESDRVDVILDGDYRESATLTVIGGSRWSPDDVARLDVAAPSLPDGDHRVKVIVSVESEVFEFRT